MKLKLIALFVTLGGLLMTFQSCEKDENETKISSYSSSESHNEGQNCMSCHVSGGDGEGWFSVAGTVYDSNQSNLYPRTTVKLYTGVRGTGTLKATVQVDTRGNFYTTESIDFGSGLYVSAVGTTGNEEHMRGKITSGQCSSCHGVTTDKVWAK